MIGQRIKQARVAAAMTQDEVVAALGALGHPLTKAGLSKYERGGSVPKPTTLRALGKVLRVPAEFFLEEARATVGVEWLPPHGARLTIAAEERIKTLAMAQVEAVVTLRRALEPKRVLPDFPRVKAPRPTVEAAEEAARQLRKAWHVGDAPIESVAGTIEDAGGIVVETDGPADVGDGAADTAFDGMAGWVDGSTPIIVVGAAVPDDARRVHLACELGRLALDAIKSDAPTMARVVKRFATAFLVPADAARRELGERRRHLDLRELAILKVKYGLSMQAWIYRATDLGIIDPAHGRSLIAELGARGWRKAEPVAFDAHERRVRERTVRERPFRLRQLTVRAHAEGLLTEAQAERICPGATRERIYWGATARRATPRRMDARTLLKLPPPERDQLLARAARLVKADYEKGGALAGFEADDE